MLDASAIPIGEFDLGGLIVRVARSAFGTVTVREVGRRPRRIGYLTADGRHEGRQLVDTLLAITQGRTTPVVRCDRCRIPLTDEASRRRGRGPECAAKPAAEGRAS